MEVDISQKKVYKWPKGIWKKVRITNHHGNANQNHREISLHPSLSRYWKRWRKRRGEDADRGRAILFLFIYLLIYLISRNRRAHLLHTVNGKVISIAAMETSMERSSKLQLEYPHYPTILLLGISPKEIKVTCWRNFCAPMFIAALLTIANKWNNPSEYNWWMDEENTAK